MKNNIYSLFFFVMMVFPLSISSAAIPSFTRLDYTLSAQATYLFSLNVNTDDILDKVSVCGKGLISIYLGKGDGSFQKEKYF